MLIVPNSILHRIWRAIRKWKNNKGLLPLLFQGISLVGVIASIVGGFGKNSNLLLYVTLGMMFLVVLYTSGRYNFLRESFKKQQDVYNSLHTIGEILRSLSLLQAKHRKVMETHNGKKYNVVDMKDWAIDFVKIFEDNCIRLCEQVKIVLIALGYPIKGVCVKRYNHEENKLFTLARVGSQGDPPPTDRGEPVSNNPFFRLLFQTHAHVDDYITRSEFKKIKQNNDSGRPRFLALGEIESNSFPKVLQPIMSGYARSRQSFETEQEEADIIAALRRRCTNYDSCLGVMISHKPYDDQKGNAVEDCRGFIGIHCTESNAWDCLINAHIGIVAMVADALYPFLVEYEYCETCFTPEKE